MTTVVCKHTMKSGPRKGSECGEGVHREGLCWHHNPETMGKRNRRTRNRKAEGFLAKRSREVKDHAEDILLTEMSVHTADMRAIGGWGSTRRGEFHRARRAWRDAVTSLYADSLNLLPETHKSHSKKAQEYCPDGEFGRCVDEECDHMVDGVYEKVRGRVTKDGVYFSDEECSDYEDCEHEEGEVHDCAYPRDVVDRSSRLEKMTAKEQRVRTLCGRVAESEPSTYGEAEDGEVRDTPRGGPRALRLELAKELLELEKMESEFYLCLNYAGK